jgi:hypothetical protein
MARVQSTVSWKRYLDSNTTIVKEYLSLFGDDFIIQTFQRILSAYQSKKSQIILIRFKQSGIVSTIESKDYLLALEYLLQLCINLEKYELCREIHNGINLLKSKKRGRVKKKAPSLVINS